MLLQLLLVGHFLTYVFDTTQPIVIVVVVAVMIGVSSGIALRSFDEPSPKKPYLIIAVVRFHGKLSVQ